MIVKKREAIAIQRTNNKRTNYYKEPDKIENTRKTTYVTWN